MVRTPRFDEARLAVEKGKLLEAMKQRNDDAGDIVDREWDWLMYGPDHYASRRLTGAELEAIGRQDLVDFHRRTYGPEGLVIAVSGDVEPEAVLARIAQGLAGWSAAERAPWPPRAPASSRARASTRSRRTSPRARWRSATAACSGGTSPTPRCTP